MSTTVANNARPEIAIAQQFADWFCNGRLMRRWAEANTGKSTVWSIRTDDMHSSLGSETLILGVNKHYSSKAA